MLSVWLVVLIFCWLGSILCVPSSHSLMSLSHRCVYRLICGVSRPDDVLECIERGVDLFESFFPYQVTERGCALTFTFDCQLNPEEKCESSEVYLTLIFHFSYFL